VLAFLISFVNATCPAHLIVLKMIIDIFLGDECTLHLFTLLKPNDIYIYIYILYICRTAALTSRRYILNIYSTNIRTEYFKHAA